MSDMGYAVVYHLIKTEAPVRATVVDSGDPYAAAFDLTIEGPSTTTMYALSDTAAFAALDEMEVMR